MGRRLLLAAAVACFGVEVLAKGSSPKSHGVRRNSAMHSKKSKKKSGASLKRKLLDDDDDDDEEEEDEYASYQAMTPYYRPRRKPSGPTIWQRANDLAKNAATQAMATSKVAATKAKVITSEAATKAHEATRLAKAYYSSDYEQFLLKATWPNDARVEPDLARKLVESVAHFPARPRTLPQDDPYRVTLRKLWKKMVEKDWRTTTKALYLMHSLSRSTPLKNSKALSRTLKSMLPDADPKTGRKYFNRRELVAVKLGGATTQRKAALVEAYAGYVLRRCLLFAAHFDDVSTGSASSKGKDVCDDDAAALKRAENVLLVLDHASQFITVALADSDAPRNAHLVVVSCLELVVHDVRDALKLASNSLERFEASRPTEADADKILDDLKKYAKLRPRLKRQLKLAAKTLRFFDLKPGAPLLDDRFDLHKAIDEWSAAVGATAQEGGDVVDGEEGVTAAAVEEPSTTLDDDDDNDDDDDDDDDSQQPDDDDDDDEDEDDDEEDEEEDEDDEDDDDDDDDDDDE